jgi:cyclophilin family peptidyl-prolyl cis-trans isomerase
LYRYSVAPRTCANFRAFIEGHAKISGKYSGCPIHRVVKDGWLQSGDVVDGTGKGCVSIYGKSFADETFKVKHDKPGILAMANSGPHTNGCQFYVTQAPLAFLDGKKVGFGRVVDGSRLLKILNRAETDTAERPVKDITIAAAAMYTLPGHENTKGPGKAKEEFDTNTAATAAAATDKALAAED